VQVSAVTRGEKCGTPAAAQARVSVVRRRAVDAVLRELPVVPLPGYSRPLTRAEDYRRLLDEHTYRGDRVRPA